MLNKTIKKIVYSIDSSLECTALAAMSIRGLCAIIPLSPEEVNRVELSVVEIVNNSIEHAYQGKAGHQVEIEVEYEGDDNLTITVSDWGASMKENFTKDQGVPDLQDPDLWKVNGRGLYIVRQLMDEVSYTTDQGKNSFRMTKQLA